MAMAMAETVMALLGAAMHAETRRRVAGDWGQVTGEWWMVNGGCQTVMVGGRRQNKQNKASKQTTPRHETQTTLPRLHNPTAQTGRD